jgi:hypothetical protein
MNSSYPNVWKLRTFRLDSAFASEKVDGSSRPTSISPVLSCWSTATESGTFL